MMTDIESARHKLPYLSVAQALKELTHNEALVRIDALLHPVIEGQSASPPTLTVMDSGKCWLVANGASAGWQGYDNAIAIWTGSSWRFQNPVEGMTVRNRETETNIMWNDANWISAPAIAEPQQGAVIDTEARMTIAALLSHLRAVGQLAS